MLSFTISNAYAEMIFDVNLMQLINRSTHITGNVLDGILINTDYCQNIVIHPKVSPGPSLDHHYGIKLLFITHYRNKPSELTTYLNISTMFIMLCNLEDMNQYLYSYNFSQFFNSRDVKFIWEQLKGAILNATNIFVPEVATHQKFQST